MSGWEIYAVMFGVVALLIGLLVWQARSGASDKRDKMQLKDTAKRRKAADKAIDAARKLWDSVRPRSDGGS